MKVEIKVLPEAKEPYAVIYASEITPEIRRTAALLETKNSAKSLFLFSLRLLSKIFSLFIEQNRPFPSFLVIIISLPSKLVKRNYLTVRRLFYERRTFSPPRLPPCGVPRCMGRVQAKKRNRFSSAALLAAMGGNSGHSFFCFSFIF